MCAARDIPKLVSGQNVDESVLDEVAALGSGHLRCGAGEIVEVGGAKVHLAPVFMEVEAPTVERMYEVAQLLGYEPKDCLSWNTYDLVQHYG